jgi:para-aminobenzoate synthetase component 1
MIEIDKKDAILKMNRYGKEQQPFFFMIDFLQEKNIVIPLSEVPSDELLFNINNLYLNVEPLNIDFLPSIEKQALSKADYEKQFNLVVDEIKKGNSFLVNLTTETPIQLNTDLKTIFYQSEANYKLWVKDKFVVFSPETFLRINKGYIYSYPMKGTIDANIENAKEVILNDPKEKAEHYTIVDLIRNDLSIIADEVSVTKFRYIDEITTEKGKLLQVSSEIKGKLPIDYAQKIGDVIYSQLPAGSVTGAPKKKTMQIIAQAENYQRNYYCGIFGVFDGVNVESAVMIRFIEQTDKGFVYKSGGGITAFSNMGNEYNELIDKIYVPIRRKY